MNEPRNTNSNGSRLLFVSWLFFPVVLGSVGYLTQPMSLFNSVMGGVYEAYIVAALYFAGFSTLSIIKYKHPHRVRIIYAFGMLLWCFAVHYIVLQNIASC